MSQTTGLIKVSPSDFAYLWEQCPRCFWLKTRHRQKQPMGLMPNIFNVIDKTIKDVFSVQELKRLSERENETFTIQSLIPELPMNGKLIGFDGWVESVPYGSYGIQIAVRGKYDTLIRWDDGTYGVIDFKTTKIKEYASELYFRQLNGYGYALTHAQNAKESRAPISQLGLVVYEPTTFFVRQANKAALRGKLAWLPVEQDEAKFLTFMDQVHALVNQKEMPDSGADCRYCAYVSEMQDFYRKLEEETGDASTN